MNTKVQRWIILVPLLMLGATTAASAQPSGSLSDGASPGLLSQTGRFLSDKFREGTLGLRFYAEVTEEEPSYYSLSGHAYDPASPLPSQGLMAGLGGAGIIGDWYPFRNGFRLSFAMYLDFVESDDFSETDRKNSGFASLSAPGVSDDAFDTIPYVGVGWKTGEQGAEGFGFNFDIGAFFPESEACDVSGSRASGCTTLPLGKRDDELFGSFQDFEWYPVLSLGIEYRF